MNNNKYLTTVELANLLDISRQAVVKKIKANEIKANIEGRDYLIPFDDLPEEIKQRINKIREKEAQKVIQLSYQKEKDLDFEKELWKAADKLRGHISPSKYKDIILGLIFLKYVSDSFYTTREFINQKISDRKSQFYISDVKARYYILDDREQYLSEGVFFIPEKARWEFLQKHALDDKISEYLDQAMIAIEEENHRLKGILPKVYTSIPIEPYVLGQLINLFSKIKLNHQDNKGKDILGRVYEYFLGQFADSEGKRGGQFYTPRSIVKLLVEILEPFEGARVFDPCCGSGGMFVQSYSYLEKNNLDPSKITFYGQELEIDTWRLCKMNLAIHGIISEDVKQGNSFYDDKFTDVRVDLVIANPPFNLDWEPERLPANDPRIKYGLAPSSNANFVWIQHFLYHLAPNGMAGFVMANGALAVGGKEGEIRKKIIEDDLIDVIIACPPKLFYNVSLPVSLWFLDKNKTNGRYRNRKGEVLFIDARDIFEPVSRKQVIFTDEQIQKISRVVKAWRGEKGCGNYQDESGFCKAVDIEEIKKAGYVLTPGRYVGIKEEEDDGVPFEKKMKRLTTEIKNLFEQGGKLEKKILDNLSKLGYEASRE